MLNLFNYQSPPTVLQVKVTPKAKKQLIKETAQPDGSVLYKIYVHEPAEDGKANKAVIALLAKSLGIAPSSLQIIQGALSRHKVIKINTA